MNNRDLLKPHDAALWALRRDMGVADDDKDGWKTLVYVLAHTFLPEKLNLSSREKMVMALTGHPDKKLKRGPKYVWTDEIRRKMLQVIDQIKDESNTPQNDQSVIGRYFSDGFEGIKVSEKTLLNQVAISRKMAKEGKL
jgi:hypothetical protein